MKHFTPPPRFRFLILSISALIISAVLINLSCNKQPVKTAEEETEASALSAKKPAAKYPGPCPYECCDPRCDAYSEPPPGCAPCEPEPEPWYANLSPSQSLYYAGEIHNEYQEDLLNQLLNQNIGFSDTIQLKSIIRNKTNAFFTTKEIDISSITTTNYFNLNYSSLGISPTKYSTQGRNILYQLESLINSYDTTNHTAFISSLNTLKQQALSLSNQTEKLTVGIPVQIAINSSAYWKINADRWLNSLGQQTTIYARVKCKVRYGQLIGSDVSGGVGGAIGGTVLGPGGTFAGAVLGSSTGSLFNLSSQVMSCLFSWW